MTAFFIVVKGEAGVIRMIGVGGADVQHAAGLEQPPEGLAHGGVVAQVLQYFGADDLVEGFRREIQFVEVALLETQFFFGNAEMTVE